MQDPTWPGELISITKSDVTVYSPVVRQIYVGTTGDVAVVSEAGVTVLFKSVPSGAVIGPFFVKQIKATGTTAADMVGFV